MSGDRNARFSQVAFSAIYMLRYLFTRACAVVLDWKWNVPLFMRQPV